MLQSQLTLHAFILKYTKLLTADIDDAWLVDQPAPGMNHPAWILGHLAIGTDFALKVLGAETQLPPDWMTRFGPGSKVTTNRADYPTKAELLTAIENGHARVAAVAGDASERRLALPQSTGILTADLPTWGALLSHLLTTHPSTHLGQLSAWRRFKGLPSVLGI